MPAASAGLSEQTRAREKPRPFDRDFVYSLKYKVLIALFAIFLLGFTYIKFRGSHTYALTDLEHEQIKPIFGKVRVWSTVDTDMTFIDVENPEKKYLIGYITPGMSETIKLERGRWYKVKASGDITVTMVNVMTVDTD